MSSFFAQQASFGIPERKPKEVPHYKTQIHARFNLNQSWKEGVIRRLSLEGLLLEAPFAISFGTAISVEIPLASPIDEKGAIHLEGKIAAQPSEGPPHLHQIVYSKTDDEDEAAETVSLLVELIAQLLMSGEAFSISKQG